MAEDFTLPAFLQDCDVDTIHAGYIILTEAQINAKMAVYLIALVLLSWLASMVGYDKVIQAITQCKKYKEE